MKVSFDFVGRKDGERVIFGMAFYIPTTGFKDIYELDWPYRMQKASRQAISFAKDNGITVEAELV